MRKLPFVAAIASLALLGTYRPAALGQPIPDPGFGDPTTLTPDRSGGLPPLTFPSGQPLPGAYGPTPPAAPISTVRPQSWPGGAPSPVPGFPAAPQQGFPQVAAAGAAKVKKSPADPPYDPAEIIARVGSERIQACEMLPMINRAIQNAVKDNPGFAALSPEEKQREIYRAQKSYMQAALKEMISTKLLVAEVRGQADTKALEENSRKIRDYFNNTYLKYLQKEYEATSVIDLENKLRELGGSIESQRSLFVEQNLARGWLSQSVRKEDKKPTHDEMLEYYKKHGSNWDKPARARWEQLTAKWSNFNSRQEAVAALARWGDDVMVRGVPFAEVAKAHSQEFAADQGGQHDWVSKGSLVSTAIDEALFSLPVGAMSQIIEDAEGCHIVRVLEREEASRTPFIEVQGEIQKALHDGGEAERERQYLEKLRQTTPVWTIFDDEQPADRR
jgi:hypothetical protein